ncbi:Uncharacterised protein [Raoultella ornithinolytica]|nr:Uncharacterised protein [Raoultella ornithinolytica]
MKFVMYPNTLILVMALLPSMVFQVSQGRKGIPTILLRCQLMQPSCQARQQYYNRGLALKYFGLLTKLKWTVFLIILIPRPIERELESYLRN